MRKLLPMPFLLLFAATAAHAQDVTTLESPNATLSSASDAKGDPNKIVCEKIERTGSRLAVDKVCMTVRQWKDHRDGQRADLEKVQEVANQQPSR